MRTPPLALIALAGVAATALPGRPEPWPVLLTHRAARLAAAAAVYSLGFFADRARKEAR